MNSFVKKIFYLMASLVGFIHYDAALAASCLPPNGDINCTLVPGIWVDQNTTPPPRLEIRTFIQDSTRINIYLLALECMQATPTNDLLSFYLISALHGTNLTWNNDIGGNYPTGYGYCYHADRLFPPWHRPYMSLYEKTLFDCATQIVQGFPDGNEKNNHLSSLMTWRMPYWDWAMDSSLPEILGPSNGSPNIVVRKVKNGKLASVRIPNPLYSYRFTILNDPNTNIPVSSKQRSQTVQTVRNPTTEDNVLVSQTSLTNNKTTQAGSDWTKKVIQALSLSTDYISFSNMADGYNSLEGVHGSIHMTVGGKNGHMAYTNYAAFDPIFYLHHANVDRLFALWQAIYPDSYLSDNASDFPNQDTELHPFRQTLDQYWTSRMARDTRAFGYTYPELVNSSQQSVIAAVNQLYSSTLIPQDLATTGNQKRKRDLTTTNSTTATGENPAILNRAQIKPKLFHVTAKEKASLTYNEYAARIKISNCAANGFFIVSIFLGEPPSDETTFATDPNFVGAFQIFARKNLAARHKKIVKGTVSMTTALYNLVATGKLKDMTRQTVKAYVMDNLKWTITGEASAGFDLDGFDITVGTMKVELPSSQYVLPFWGKFSTVYKVVSGSPSIYRWTILFLLSFSLLFCLLFSVQ